MKRNARILITCLALLTAGLPNALHRLVDLSQCLERDEQPGAFYRSLEQAQMAFLANGLA